MECPNCKYVRETMYPEGIMGKSVEIGEDGEFYKLPIEMVRSGSGYYGDQRKDVLACPKCRIVFISDF